MNDKYIIYQYVKKDRSAASIAKDLGCCEKTVSLRLRKCGIPTKRRIKQDRKQDLNGKSFGRLTVISFCPTDDSTDYFWICNCKCGTQKTFRARDLLRKDGPVKSCGCARRKNCDWDNVPPYLLSTVRCKANYRGINYNLTLKYCDMLFQKQNKRCALSGLPLVFGRRRDIKTTTASLDRINSSLPYEEGNVQWVHKKINIMKNSLSDEEFIEFCNKVSSYNREK